MEPSTATEPDYSVDHGKRHHAQPVGSSPAPSDDETLDKPQPASAYCIFVICFVCLSTVAYGYAGSIIATTLTQPSFHERMKLDTDPRSEGLIGAMNGLFYAGGVIGSFLAGWTNNLKGRKFTLVIGNSLILISGALLTASVNPEMFIVFRFFSGVGAFVNLATVPQWVSEISPPRVRGVLTDIHAVFMLGGYTLATFAGFGTYFAKKNAWMIAMSFQMVFPAIVLCGIHWMPESPRYLVTIDRLQEAHDVLYRLHSNAKDPDHEFARRELYQIQKQIALDKTLSKSYLDIFRTKSLRRRALITMFLEFSLMSSGILVVLNYGSLIWRGLGFNTVQTLGLQAGFKVCGLTFNALAMLFVDKVKRNHLISYGFFAVSAVVATLTALQAKYVGTEHRAGLIGCALMIFMFQAVYSVLLDGSTFFYIAEIWPSHVRASGFAIAMGTLSFTNIIWLQAAPDAFVAIGWRFYLFFIIIPFIAGVTAYFFFPDTLHKPLEEIAALFGDDEMVAVYQQQLQREGIPVDDEFGQVLYREKAGEVASVQTVERVA